MEENNNPKHVAIILDGNRRFAKRLMLEPWKGHEYGADKVEKLLEYAKDLGIKELTFYALSVENIKERPKTELDVLYRIFKEAFKKLEKDKIHQNKVKIRFLGRLELLPNDLRELCEKLMEETKDYDGFIVNFCVAYGGRQELADAVKRIIENKVDSEEVNEELIENYLYMHDDPDLIIRTGGQKRTSNFLPWQSTYSEWFFLDKMWPEFEQEDLKKCIEEFKGRQRNFGK